MKQTIGALLAHGENTFRALRLPPDDALILLSHCLNRESAYMLSHPDMRIPDTVVSMYYRCLDQRSKGFSVAAIIGYRYFYGLRFAVTADTLIPRLESELLVYLGISYLSSFQKATVLDMGTGCGNLIISLAVRCAQRTISWYACDISPKALRIARQNARSHRVSIRFIHSNLFSHVPKKRFNLIVTNLPYLATEQLSEPSIRREPIGALWGGTRGIELYKQFLAQAPSFLAERAALLLEIDPHQKMLLTDLITRAFPEGRLEFHKDLGRRTRVAAIHLNGTDGNTDL